MKCAMHNIYMHYLDFLAEVPLIPFLHVPMDLLLPLFNRKFPNFVES